MQYMYATGQAIWNVPSTVKWKCWVWCWWVWCKFPTSTGKNWECKRMVCRLSPSNGPLGQHEDDNIIQEDFQVAASRYFIAVTCDHHYDCIFKLMICHNVDGPGICSRLSAHLRKLASSPGFLGPGLLCPLLLPLASPPLKERRRWSLGLACSSQLPAAGPPQRSSGTLLHWAPAASSLDNRKTPRWHRGLHFRRGASQVYHGIVRN